MNTDKRTLRKHSRLRNLVFLFALLLLPVSAPGQESRGTILGRITDPGGASVAGAAIEVINVETGVALRTTTNDLGNYQLPFLAPGNYTVRVEGKGFKRIERPGIRVSTNTQVTLDFTLELGEVSETVTVTDRAPLLSVSTADLGQVFDTNYIGTTPITLTRNVLNTVYLAPGVKEAAAQ
jgi:hypothetical protein